MATRSWTAARSSEPRVGRRLGRSFFDRPGVPLARALLGCRLDVRGPDGIRSVRLVETEAYLRGDPASHAFRGATRRNRSMFSRPGTLYIYRIHQVVCANLVARRGEAALLRAGEVAGAPPGAGTGPGRLCRALGLSLADDGADVTRGPRLTLRAPGSTDFHIAVGPRVGIRQAAERPLRFWIAGDPAVSRWRPASAGASPSRSRDGARTRRSRTTSTPASAGGRSGGRSGGR